jgi:hypothetical protein
VASRAHLDSLSVRRLARALEHDGRGVESPLALRVEAHTRHHRHNFLVGERNVRQLWRFRLAVFPNALG